MSLTVSVDVKHHVYLLTHVEEAFAHISNYSPAASNVERSASERTERTVDRPSYAFVLLFAARERPVFVGSTACAAVQLSCSLALAKLSKAPQPRFLVRYLSIYMYI